MCDYSQNMSVRDFCIRRAKVGDELELIRIAGHIRGFALRTKKDQVVTCLRPGTEVVFEKRFLFEGMRTFVDCDNGERMMVTDMAPTREARTALLPGWGQRLHCDGVEWPDGRGMALNCLPMGIRIKVLQLPAVKRRKAKRKVEAKAERELVLVER